jgi:N,N'-diacetyllegionaminate synthase
LIIAEAGVNHNGDPAMSLALVDAASAAGADVVKFQTFRADRLVTQAARKAEYQVRTTGGDESQLAMLRRLEMTTAMHEAVIARCAERGIEFLSTGFDEDSIDLLVGLGITRLKIPSGEITNLPYLRHVGHLGLQVLLSTGMATLADIEGALEVLADAGTPRERVTILQCTTEYPAPMADVNLKAMDTIRDAFGVSVGFSDHTQGITAAIAAVARGATVIEKHFTLDRTLPGPDHQASLEPDELRNLVAAIRDVEAALGDGHKRPTESERRTRTVARRSIVAARPIRAGEVLTEADLAAKRPGGGLSPMRWHEVIGRPASRDFAEDEWIVL